MRLEKNYRFENGTAQHRLQRTGGLRPPERMLRNKWHGEPIESHPAARR